METKLHIILDKNEVRALMRLNAKNSEVKNEQH